MTVTINKVKSCKNGAYGNFLLRGRDRAQITISLKLNKLLAEYGATVLHELLHLWMTLLRKEGFKATNKREHEFIYAVENRLFKEMKRVLKRG